MLMEKSAKKKIVVIRENSLKNEYSKYSCIVRVYFDNTLEPILLASNSELKPLECTEFVRKFCLYSEKNTRVDYLKSTITHKTKDNNE